MNYKGIIIEESLQNTDVLKSVKILNTIISPVTERHQTPWVKQWTMHTVEVDEKIAESLAQQISETMDPEHSWFADYNNGVIHYIIFYKKVFKVDMIKEKEYAQAKDYGLSINIPDHQLIFVKRLIK